VGWAPGRRLLVVSGGGSRILVISFAGDWWLGEECSFETGYEHSLGIMNFVPLLFLVGLAEVVVAIILGATHTWPPHVARKLGLVAAGVIVLSFAAYLQAVTYSMQFSCD
jgi:hypothetical protein